MTRNIKQRVAALGTALLVLLSSAPLASAATNSGGNGLRVSPVRSDLTVSPGTSATVPVTVTNVTSAPGTLQAIINDFTASSDESGNPAILLGNNQYASSHSLKRFVQPVGDFTLQPGQEETIKVNITIPKGTAAGGYYGAIRFAPASTSIGVNQNLSLAGSVGSLILVTVPGKVVEKLSITSFDVRSGGQPSTFFTRNKGIEAMVRFQNEGNLQEAPFGKILLKNRSGKILGQYELNNVEPPGEVLPNSIRRFPVPLTKLSSFGIFKLEGNFGYGSNGQLLSASTTFYVVPTWLILLFIAIVLFLVFLIFGLPRLVRAYNRRVVRRASRRH